ncbi:MAG: MBL fold metallo-hydrolase [Sulfolobales archaeon]
MGTSDGVVALGSGGRTYVLRFVVGVLDTNMYLVYDEETRDSILIDVGGDPSEALFWIRRLDLNLVAVISTHGHFDHVVGVPRLERRAPSYIHRADVETVKISMEWYSRYTGEKLEEPIFDVLLDSDAKLKLGSIELEVLHTPGHSPGSISIYVPSASALFTGDTLFAGTVGRTDLPGGSPRELAKSINKIFSRVPLDTLAYPGHGPHTTLRREMRVNPYVEEALAGSSRFQ